MSYVVAEEDDGIYYYIRTLASGTAFELGLHVPEDYDAVSVTDFELRIKEGTEQVQVGERIPVDGKLKHLQLDIASVDRVFIRLYNGSEFVDDCDIEPSEYSGRLDIVTDYRIEKNEDEKVGTYTVETTGTGLALISITPSPARELRGTVSWTRTADSSLTGAGCP